MFTGIRIVDIMGGLRTLQTPGSIANQVVLAADVITILGAAILSFDMADHIHESPRISKFGKAMWYLFFVIGTFWTADIYYLSVYLRQENRGASKDQLW